MGTFFRFMFGNGPRIGRQQFWLGWLLSWITGTVLVLVASFLIGLLLYSFSPTMAAMLIEDETNSSLLSSLLVLLLVVPLVLVVWIKRLRDRNRSPWLAILLAVPLLNIPVFLWLLIECGFLRGTVGPNRYGPDPLGATG